MIKPNNFNVLAQASLTLETQDSPDLKMKRKQSAEFLANPNQTQTIGSQQSNVNLEIQEEESMSEFELHKPSF
jgi:hypothetical protein